MQKQFCNYGYYNNVFDTHTHSIHSFDGNNSCRELCLGAIKNGIKMLAITDHCDIDGKDVDPDKLCPPQLEDIEECQKEFEGKLTIFKGLEIGQGIYLKAETERLLKKYDYDFCLGSLHNLENMPDFYFIDYDKYDISELLKRYFDGLIELCKWGKFDSLAHLTYPLRYIWASKHISVDMTEFAEQTDEIFSLLVSKDKALEINTSGYFMELGDSLPNIELVKRFKALGGKYITVGSDSHYAGRVGQGIELGMKAAADAGFSRITVFKKHQPMLYTIE